MPCHIVAVGVDRARVDAALDWKGVPHRTVTVDGADGVAAAVDDHEVDCVVSGHTADGVDLFAVLEAVSGREDSPPVVAFVTDGSEALAGEAVAAGVEGYVPAGVADAEELLGDRVLAAVGGAGDPTDDEWEIEPLGRLMRQFARNANAGIWLATAEFDEMLFMNRAYRELGFSREALYEDPRAYLDSLHPEDRDDEEESLARMREWADAGDAPDEFRDNYRVVDGDTVHWIEEVTFPIREDGEIVRWGGILENVTQRHAYEAELERQNRRLKEFASVVSHDLRNPLNAAQGHLALAAEERDSEHLDAVSRSLDRMNGLIESLLTAARKGDRVTDPESVDLDGVVHEAAAAAEVGRVDADGLPTVRGDPERVRRLFENLFRNAAEHAGPDAAIRAGPLPGGFFVEDDGPGIPATDRDRVFEKGYSTDATGTGFGLAIVEEIATGHGWEVAATEGETGGARFEFTGIEVG